MIYGLPNVDGVGWNQKYPNYLGLYHSNGTADGVAPDGAGDKGWYLGYWWEFPDGGIFIVGW
ncbi:MAG: hypothetical protein HQK85_04360 [Nitrospinae bacterium]|nr:hypothetical protein [Nitrospinota bacterium]